MAFTTQKFRVEGLAELDHALKELPKATARNGLTRVLKRQAQPIANDAAAMAPVDPVTGGRTLREEMLVLSVPAKRREADVEVAVGPSQKVFYGMFQEFGTAHHGPQAFLRPSWDSNVPRVLEGIRKDLADEIEKIRARVARKAEREAAKMMK